MNERLERDVLGFPLTVELIRAGPDLQVSIRGGERPHIGSVTVAAQGNAGVALRTWHGPGHRDDVIGDAFAQALARRTGGTVCVSCGIHYDNLSRAQIETVVEQARLLLDDVLLLFPEQS